MHGRPSVRSPWRLNNLTNGPGRCTTQRHDDRNEEARILWSQMFSHALRLHRYDEAYLALISNPDAERRQDGLSHFVTVVCENGQERLLSELPFAGLQTELESTLAFKARNAAWLDDYALFRALKEANGGRAWYEWPAAARRHETASEPGTRAASRMAVQAASVRTGKGPGRSWPWRGAVQSRRGPRPTK